MEQACPVTARAGLPEQSFTGLAAAGMLMEGCYFLYGQRAVEQVDQSCFPAGALFLIFGQAAGFARVLLARLGAHQLTCFLPWASRRASSARPRLMRDFTVPSGMRNTAAISL